MATPANKLPNPTAEQLESKEYWLEANLTVEETQLAIRKYRARGFALFLPCGQFAISKEGPNKGYSVMSHIRVDKKQAAQYITDAYRSSIAEKALVHVTALGKCVFIGMSQ